MQNLCMPGTFKFSSYNILCKMWQSFTGRNWNGHPQTIRSEQYTICGAWFHYKCEIMPSSFDTELDCFFQLAGFHYQKQVIEYQLMIFIITNNISFWWVVLIFFCLVVKSILLIFLLIYRRNWHKTTKKN